MELKTQFSLSLALAIALVSGAAIAKETDTSAKTLTPQQQRMVDCNKEATGKTGDERKTFMSTCLKGGTAAAPAAKMTQQEKMTSSNAEAKTKALTGDARKTFMSTCLKGDDAAAAAPTATPAATAKVTQQEKMKSCSTDAKTKGLKGEERKTFMSTCLKG
jgi:hypothetical protein